MPKTNSTAPVSPWHWPQDKVVAVLGNNVARAMMAGKSCPVAEKVLARLSA